LGGFFGLNIFLSKRSKEPNFMKKIVDYLPLLTICLIYFGFTNLHYYYQEFKIDIYNYITNSEILLSFLPTIVIITIMLYSFLYNMIVNHSGKKEESKPEQNDAQEEPKKKKKKSFIGLLFARWPVYIILYYVITIVIRIILLKFYFKFEIQTYEMLVSIGFVVVLYFVLKATNNLKLISENQILFGLFFITYIGIQLGEYRKLDAARVKHGISEKNISFRFNQSVTVRTSRQLVYLGQTQNNLFLYDRRTKSSIVYKISSIDSLVLQ
jgi:hypothetical protein